MFKLLINIRLVFFEICKMASEEIINTNFGDKLEKTATDTLKILYEAYGDFCISRARVLEWYKQFVEDLEDVEDDPKRDRLSTSKTDANI